MPQLLDQLRSLYGIDSQNQQIDQMLQLDPQGLDPATAMATSAEPAMPEQLPEAGMGAQQSNLGHPDVLSFLKQLEADGAFQGGGDNKPAGMQAKGASITGEIGGPSPELEAASVAATRQNELDDAAVDTDRMLSDSEELAKQAAYKRMDADIALEETQRQEQETAAKQEQLRSQQEELAQQADEPINPKRYYENMSIFAKGAALISAGIHGYLMKGGTPFVVDALQDAARQDVQAQIANNSAAKSKREGLIAQYERQYGDAALVAKRLEADKLHQFAKKAQAEELDAKSAEKKAIAEDIKKKLQNRVGVIHTEIQKAMAGKPMQQTTTYETPKPKGGGLDAAAKLKKAADLNKALAEAGATPEERVAMLRSAGLTPIAGQTMSEKKREDDIAEKDRKRGELSPEAQTDVRKRVDGLAEMVQGMDELDNAVGFKRGADGEVIDADEKKLDRSIRSAAGQVAQSFSNALPWGMNKGAGELAQKLSPEDVKQLERARDKIVFGQAKAEGAGALGDAEREGYRQRIPTDSPLSVQRSSAQMWRARRQQYENLKGQYGKDVVDEMLRKRGIDPTSLGD